MAGQLPVTFPATSGVEGDSESIDSESMVFLPREHERWGVGWTAKQTPFRSKLVGQSRTEFVATG